MSIYTEDCSYNKLNIRSNIKFCGYNYINTSKKVYCILKPLIYYLYSTTYKRKFIREKILIVGGVSIVNYLIFRDSDNTHISVSTILDFEEPEKDFLKNCDDEELNRNLDIGNEMGLYMFDLRTFYHFRDGGDQLLALIELGENGELDNGLIVDELYRGNLNSESVSDDEKIINSSQSFKSDKCVICLTNPPHVLFCKCGHICICGECGNRFKNKKCPVCKTENTIIRKLK